MSDLQKDIPMVIKEQVPGNNTSEAVPLLEPGKVNQGDGKQGSRSSDVEPESDVFIMSFIESTIGNITVVDKKKVSKDIHYPQPTDPKHPNRDTNSGKETSSKLHDDVVDAATEITGECVDTVNVLSADDSQCEEIQRKKGYYPVKENRGCAIILSNDFADSEEKNLPGYKKDKGNMKKLLKGLGCHPVRVYSNEEAEQIEDILKDFVKGTTKTLPSYIVVVILSHGRKVGDKQVFEGNDGKPVEVDFVLDLFNNEKAEHLQNIPKLFIFQFCRGDKTDSGTMTASSLPSGPPPSTIPLSKKILLPVYSDQFVAYSTHDYYTALVDRDGSWFINAITNIFMKHAKDEHVADLFTMVNKAVKDKTGTLAGKGVTCKQMSVSVSSLTEKLYLFPGYHPNRFQQPRK